MFVTCLGGLLLFGARGDVYVVGGIAPRPLALCRARRFRGAFEEKGRLWCFLAPIPVFVILAELATLRGAAAGCAQALPGRKPLDL